MVSICVVRLLRDVSNDRGQSCSKLTGPVDPREAADVRSTVLSTDNPKALTCCLLLSQAVVQDLIQAFCLVLIAVDAILNLLRSVAVEMVCCSQWSDTNSSHIDFVPRLTLSLHRSNA